MSKAAPNRPRPWLRRLGPPGWLAGLDRLAMGGGAPVVWGNRVTLLEGGRAAHESMLEAIRGASRAIAVEMYTFADDRAGRRFAEALRGKAREGIRVRVLVDAFGSLGSGDLMESLEQVGVEVRWYHPLAPWTPTWYPNRRDHRKILLVDGASGFAGGMNLAEAYTEEFAGERAWTDLAVRIEGPAVPELSRLFVRTWIRAGGSPGAAGDLGGAVRESGPAGVQVVEGAGLLGRRGLRKSHLALIRMSRKKILLANAYFAPGRPLQLALARAARRGVRVDLLLSGVTDVPMVRWAGRASYGRLLEAGVRIREARRSVLHAKAAVFDDRILLAGSANLDHRSIRHNLEVAVNVFDRSAVEGAAAFLEREYSAAQEVTLDDWRRRPARDRILERLASAFRYWL
jgi:cardiolipin synthase A/B